MYAENYKQNRHTERRYYPTFAAERTALVRQYNSTVQCWPDARAREKNERGEKRARTTGSKKRSAATRATVFYHHDQPAGHRRCSGGGISFSRPARKQEQGRGWPTNQGTKATRDRSHVDINNMIIQYTILYYYVWSRSTLTGYVIYRHMCNNNNIII